jgi:hypothetical protein
MAATKPAQKPASAASNTRSALIWGGLALCSILAVCGLIAFRIGAAGGSIVSARVSTTPPPAQPVIQKPQGASEFEVARLNDAVRALAAERDRLSARVETLEQSVGDITASITKKPAKETADRSDDKQKQEASSSDPSEPRAAAPSAPPDKPVAFQAPLPSPNPPYPTLAQRSMPYLSVTLSPPKSDKTAEKPVERAEPSEAEERAPAHVAPIGKTEPPSRVARTAVTQPMPPPVRRPPRQARAVTPPPPVPPLPPETTASKGPPTQVAQILQQSTPAPEITGATRTEFGVDLGGETSLDGLRARWTNIKGRHGEALEGLRPLVRVREGSRPGTVELHLVVGPVANAGTAARVCAKLQSAGIACQASEYDGQRLSIR